MSEREGGSEEEFIGRIGDKPDIDSSDEKEDDVKLFNRVVDRDHLTRLVKYLSSVMSTATDLMGASARQNEYLDLKLDGPEGLARRVNNSDEQDWNKHPAYYNAVLIEIRRRNLI